MTYLERLKSLDSGKRAPYPLQKLQKPPFLRLLHYPGSAFSENGPSSFDRELARREVLKMLGDGREYAVFVPDDSADPVIAYCGVKGVATFELHIPRHSYNGMVLLELLERYSKGD